MAHPRKVTLAIFVVFTIAMNPPVILLVDSPTTVLGVNSLYLWTVAWGVFITLVLVWAAWRDAFALTEDQVPPELRQRDDVADTEANPQDVAVKGDT